MSRNNVRGPTSALTEFLKASGITPATIARRAAVRSQAQAEDQQPVAGPSRSSNAETSTSTRGRGRGRGGGGGNARLRRRSTRNSGYASDDLDEPEDDAEAAAGEDASRMDVDEDQDQGQAEEEQEEAKPSAAKKRKLTKAAEAKLKAKEKKKRGIKDSDGDHEEDEDEEEDAYTALSKSMWTNGAAKPPVGSFEICALCEKQFTVTKYTMAYGSGPGFLCHQCAKQSGNDPFKKPAVPKKRRAPADKRSVTHFEQKRFPTLVSLCIQLITKHIDDIDAFGDIGAMNVEAIAKALSKNRSLTTENAHLFYSPANLTLTFYDATNLASPALETLAYHNANLVSLRLDFCGHLDDASFKVFATSLPALERIELLGPFLVRPAGWQNFFKSHPNLRGFLITQNPRFDEKCMQSLVKNCPQITELRLKQIGLMQDSFLTEIATLKNGLQYLDLSEPTESCSEEAMILFLRHVGKTLTHLNVSKHEELTDEFLKIGLLKFTGALQSLVLSYLPEITDQGLSEFFDEWTANPPLFYLDVSRQELLGSAALESILKHSGAKLEELNINGWKDVGEESLKMIGDVAGQLKKVDVGFCRAVDDFVIQEWLEGKVKRGHRSVGCSKLEEIKVWGCNRITSSCPRKKGVSILGVESR